MTGPRNANAGDTSVPEEGTGYWATLADLEEFTNAGRFSGMGRRAKPVDPQQGPLAAFTADLWTLRAGAGADAPTMDQISDATGVPRSTLYAALKGDRVPGVKALAALVQAWGGDEEAWTIRRGDLQVDLVNSARVAERSARKDWLAKGSVVKDSLRVSADDSRTPLGAFAADLRTLWAAAGADAPTIDQISDMTGVPRSTLYAAVKGAFVPGVKVLTALVRAWGGDETAWNIMRDDLLITLAAAKRSAQWVMALSRADGLTAHALRIPAPRDDEQPNWDHVGVKGMLAVTIYATAIRDQLAVEDVGLGAILVPLLYREVFLAQAKILHGAGHDLATGTDSGAYAADPVVRQWKWLLRTWDPDAAPRDRWDGMTRGIARGLPDPAIDVLCGWARGGVDRALTAERGGIERRTTVRVTASPYENLVGRVEGSDYDLDADNPLDLAPGLPRYAVNLGADHGYRIELIAAEHITMIEPQPQ